MLQTIKTKVRATQSMFAFIHFLFRFDFLPPSKGRERDEEERQRTWEASDNKVNREMNTSRQ